MSPAARLSPIIRLNKCSVLLLTSSASKRTSSASKKNESSELSFLPPVSPSLLPENCAALNKFTTEPLRYAARFSFFPVVNCHVIIDFSAPFSLFSSINFDIDKDSPVSASFLHHLIVCVS